MNLFDAWIVTACFFFAGLFVMAFVMAVINRSIRIRVNANHHVVQAISVVKITMTHYRDLVGQVAEKTGFKTSSLDEAKIIEEQVEHLRKLGFKI